MFIDNSMGLADRIYQDAIEVYFHLAAKLTTPLRPGAAFAIVVTRGPTASPERRSLWRPGWGTDQCVEVKIPAFFRCTGKPSSADVTSVVYARQRHPRTARLQLNDLTGLERLCHDLILANVTLCPSSYGAATGAKKRYGALPPSSLSVMHLQRVRTRDA